MSSGVASGERTFSLGLGLTNECNLACSFCYRDPTRGRPLGPEQVRAVLDAARPLGQSRHRGERHASAIPEMVALLRAEPIKLTITSNGHFHRGIDDAQVRAFADVEFSIDYPTREEQDRAARAGQLGPRDSRRHDAAASALG